MDPEANKPENTLTAGVKGFAMGSTVGAVLSLAWFILFLQYGVGSEIEHDGARCQVLDGLWQKLWWSAGLTALTSSALAALFTLRLLEIGDHKKVAAISSLAGAVASVALTAVVLRVLLGSGPCL